MGGDQYYEAPPATQDERKDDTDKKLLQNRDAPLHAAKHSALLQTGVATPSKSVEPSLLDVGSEAPVKGLKGEEPFLDKDLPADAKNGLDDFSRSSKYEAPMGDQYYEAPPATQDDKKDDKDKKLLQNNDAPLHAAKHSALLQTGVV